MSFSADFIEFFKELGANNNKQWFDENRKRYEKSVRDPFKQFVEQVINELRTFDPEIDIEAKDAIFRINRDIRFSKDKTPYKNHLGAIVSPTGKKNREVPGIYFQFSAESLIFYGGVYELSKNNLEDFRHFMATNASEFNSIISDKEFIGLYSEIQGEKAKRIPKELKEAAEKQPLIYNKQFYFYNELPTSKLTEPNLLELVVNHYKVALKFSQFVRKAIHY